MKTRPFEDELLCKLAERHGTPLYVYDAATIRARLAALLGAGSGRGFDVVRYAQKANPNLSILRLLREGGALVDAVSAGELARALIAGWEAASVVYCADLFDRPALAALALEPFALTLGSADMLEYAAALRPRGHVALRINPGFGDGHHAKVITGGKSSKHGIWHADLPAVLTRARELELTVDGLHVHIGSGIDPAALEPVTQAMGAWARLVGPELESISAGGGLPIPYRSGAAVVDLDAVADLWDDAREAIESDLGRRVRLEVEPGRYLVAEAGVLLGEVRGSKHSGTLEYLFSDAGFHDLVRTAMYGAWHELSIVGRDSEPHSPRVVAGPLCESADVFTLGPAGELAPRELPAARVGDLLCVHDAGAYGASMSSTYNSRPLAAEVLVDHGEARLVRRRQTLAELFALEREVLDEAP